MENINNEYLIKIERNASDCNWNKLYETLDRSSSKSKKLRDSKKSLKEYKKLLESKNYTLLLNRKIKDEEDLITAMCIAYSWMPTMLDIIGSEIQIKQLATKIEKLDLIEWYSPTEKEIISKLSRLTNNSIVGAVKTLHLIEPNRYPLIDSRVLIAWKRLFGTLQNKGIVDPLGASWNVGKKDKNLNKLIDKYFYYRAFLYFWSSKLKKGVKPRDIEFRLYILGDKE